MPQNHDHGDQETERPTDDTRAETDGADDQAGGATETPISRRNALIGAGVGVGLFNGMRPAPSEGRRRWNQHVDANGNNLLNLNGLNMDSMAERALITDFEGSNLELSDNRLNVADQLDVERVGTAELTGRVTGGKILQDLVGDNLSIDNNRLNATTESNWQRSDGLLAPGDGDVDGIEVTLIESPENDSLNIESGDDLVLSISGGRGAVRIETEGGHKIVLNDEDEAESLSIEDSAGNSVEMDSTTGEVSISANQKIALDAPTIELTADLNIIESAPNIELNSSIDVDITGPLIKLNGGTRPVSGVGDLVSGAPGGLRSIATGSSTVFID